MIKKINSGERVRMYLQIKNYYEKAIMVPFCCLIAISLIGLITVSCNRSSEIKLEGSFFSTQNSEMIAKVYNSGFADSHDSYNGLSTASNGKVYYVLSSELIDKGGQMFSFDPMRDSIEYLGDLNEFCGEKDLKNIAQGKCHVNFIENEGKLYFATHMGYYTISDGIEKVGIPSNGFKEYQGGHLLAYNVEKKTCEDLGVAPHKEGIITMNMDTKRGFIYGLTWPTGYFFRYDIARREMKDLGPFTKKGEAGEGQDFRVICRSIAIDPETGNVYLTNSEGQIKFLKLGSDVVEVVQGVDLIKDYFGVYDASQRGSMAYNWRQTFWYHKEKNIYGVHGNSGYLFRFDPRTLKVEVLERLTSIPSRKSGMADQFSYGYLGFKLGPDERTIYYLTGAPADDGQESHVEGDTTSFKGGARGVENLHLITYDIPTGRYIDHGAIFYSDGQRPLYVNSVAIGSDGTIYTLARITENNITRTDLVKIPNPFRRETNVK